MIIFLHIDNHNDQAIQHGNNLFFFLFINSFFSPGNGTVNQLNQWSRYCSYQNSGLPQNDTQPNIARLFCENELSSTASSPVFNLFFSVMFIILFQKI